MYLNSRFILRIVSYASFADPQVVGKQIGLSSRKYDSAPRLVRLVLKNRCSSKNAYLVFF